MRVGALVHVAGHSRASSIGIEPEGERIIEFRGADRSRRRGRACRCRLISSAPSKPADTERYQTVFARERGAVAAPTAGLHFTPEMLARIPHTFLTLHVGVGTFRSVLTDDLREHRMHSERFRVTRGSGGARSMPRTASSPSAPRPRACSRSCGRPRPRAVRGARHLHSSAVQVPRASTRCSPIFTSRKATLLMLVSAFAGANSCCRAYAEAIRERYRFYSYGDCMLIR